MRIVIGRGTHRKAFTINSHDARHNRPSINAILGWAGVPEKLHLRTNGATNERTIRRAPA
jgi:hypothetical protein